MAETEKDGGLSFWLALWRRAVRKNLLSKVLLKLEILWINSMVNSGRRLRLLSNSSSYKKTERSGRDRKGLRLIVLAPSSKKC